MASVSTAALTATSSFDLLDEYSSCHYQKKIIRKREFDMLLDYNLELID